MGGCKNSIQTLMIFDTAHSCLEIQSAYFLKKPMKNTKILLVAQNFNIALKKAV